MGGAQLVDAGQGPVDGVGAAKLPYLESRLGADQMALLRRIKAAFDPAGILNPGKLGS